MQKLLGYLIDQSAVDKIKEGRRGIVVLNTTPFYAESGGQVGDQWFLQAKMVGLKLRIHIKKVNVFCIW